MDNYSLDVSMTESERDNELLKNQQSDAMPIIETMDGEIARRTEMIPKQEEQPKSFWQKYKVLIILLIVVVVIGVGLGIYFYLDSRKSGESNTGELETANGDSSPAETVELSSKSPVTNASPDVTSPAGDLPTDANVSHGPTSAGPDAPSIPEANPATQAGGSYSRYSISSSSPSLTSDMPFLSLFRF